jgi:hypothetical protein
MGAHPATDVGAHELEVNHAVLELPSGRLAKHARANAKETAVAVLRGIPAPQSSEGQNGLESAAKLLQRHPLPSVEARELSTAKSAEIR